MIKDKMSEIYDALMSDEELSKITIKSFERPETLPTNQTSIVIIPLGPPIQSDQGSNTSFSKTFPAGSLCPSCLVHNRAV